MNIEPSDFKKLFTVEEANAALPLVRVICKDLAELAHDVKQRRERLAMLMPDRDESRPDVYGEELTQI